MKFFNRVGVVSSTTGTGTITLGAVLDTNMLAFAESGAADGDEVYYLIDEGGNFEIGIGTIGGSETTLSRDTVLVSKISGTAGTTKLTLAGAAQVRCVTAAEALGLSVRADIAQSFSAGEKAQGRANIGLLGTMVNIRRILHLVDGNSYNSSSTTNYAATGPIPDADGPIGAASGITPQSATSKLLVISHARATVSSGGGDDARMLAALHYFDGTAYQVVGVANRLGLTQSSTTTTVVQNGQLVGSCILTQDELRSDNDRWFPRWMYSLLNGSLAEIVGAEFICIEYEELAT